MTRTSLTLVSMQKARIDYHLSNTGSLLVHKILIPIILLGSLAQVSIKSCGRLAIFRGSNNKLIIFFIPFTEQMPPSSSLIRRVT
jgi:hypothetical protein